MPAGYYRFPTLHEDSIVFVCEDDLWSVHASGGLARRLTSSLGEISRPCFSPDGTQLIFIGREEGQSEVYLMPALGGPARRLTYLGSSLCLTAGWTADGRVLFASNARQPFNGLLFLYSLGLDEPEPRPLNLGPARSIAYGPDGGVVVGRHTTDPARWKRYRGGTVGRLWIDEQGVGEFHPLLSLQSNLASPLWLSVPGTSQGRIFFLSDHEGVGNLYSCLPSGDDLRRHTDHSDYYARSASSDGRRIVYHAGGDLFLYDPVADASLQVPVEFHSPRRERSRKFVDPGRYLHDWKIHPQGHSLALSARGKLFTFANWEGAVLQHNPTPESPNGETPDTAIRLRLPRWLKDGKRLIAVSDAGGEEAWIVWSANGSGEPKRYDGLDIGRPDDVAVNPQKDQIVFSNHRYELLCLDLVSGELRTIDRGLANSISGFNWSPDGEWIAYSVSISLQVNTLKLWKASTGEIFPLTRPVLRDVAPAFDPLGKYLYFISYRTFDPVYDNLHFDLNFPRGMKPYLITLQKDLPSPFIPRLRQEAAEKKEDDEGQKKEQPEEAVEKDDPQDAQDRSAENDDKSPPTQELKRVQIDLDGIERRIIAFPVQEGIYGRALGAKDGKVLYTRFPVEGALNQHWADTEPASNGTLLSYNFEDLKEETLFNGISDFDLTPGGGILAYRSGRRLRVLKVGEKPNGEYDGPNRKSGWIDLGRVKLSILPGAEWRQMFREAWRLQRDNFWTSDMSQVDWLSVHDRYFPLVDRVSARSEFSDLLWDMQGELGTSHAYEMGGDYRPEPYYALGNLGADFAWDPQAGAWRITHILQGDPWEPKADSPLNAPGVNASVGDLLLAVNGQKLDARFSPGAALINLAGQEVILTLQDAAGSEPRQVTVKALHGEMSGRYREWVERNRSYVHAATGGRAGYVHIPDMGPHGYAEFHRGFLAEVDREGLIVDVRYNGGGHVSSLILEKLARRRLGYGLSRWGQEPYPYPPESVLGSMVALTNELAGSDGDIFSHGFKMMGLGPLIGKRTWGGVIGINPHHLLVDGTITTQPEFSFWFSDVGWGVENYGTDPDIEVDDPPQDWARGIDAQLDRAIAEVLSGFQDNPPSRPVFEGRPSKAPPSLPTR